MTASATAGTARPGSSSASVHDPAWWVAVALLAAVYVAIALTAYADVGLPGVPHVAHAGLQGDATGFYAQARELMAAFGRMPRALLALEALVVLSAAAAAVRLRRRPALQPWLAPAALFVAGLCLVGVIHWMRAAGAAVFGWPLVWGLVMLPYRALGLPLGTFTGWEIGTGVSLLFVALTVVAVAYLGRNAMGDRRAGLLAAGLWTAWPLLVGLISGHRAWENDQWSIGIGLHGYDEPLSTLLVTSAAALLLARSRTRVTVSLAGCLLSLATCVKLSNAVVAAVALVLLAGFERRRVLPFLAGAVSFAPVVLAYWPLGYARLFGNRSSWPSDPFDVSYIVPSWTHSLVFTPRALAIIVPLAALGVLALRRNWQRALVLAFLLVNPVFYSFFANTPQHPRFLYASLPELFVLWAAGASALASLARRSSHAEPTSASHAAASPSDSGVTR